MADDEELRKLAARVERRLFWARFWPWSRKTVETDPPKRDRTQGLHAALDLLGTQAEKQIERLTTEKLVMPEFTHPSIPPPGETKLPDVEKHTLTMPAGQAIRTWDPPTALVIQASMNKIMVAFKPDGSIEFGEGYTPTDAARTFWLHMANQNPLLGMLREMQDDIIRQKEVIATREEALRFLTKKSADLAVKLGQVEGALYAVEHFAHVEVHRGPDTPEWVAAMDRAAEAHELVDMLDLPKMPSEKEWEECASVGEDGVCGVHKPGTQGCVSTRPTPDERATLRQVVDHAVKTAKFALDAIEHDGKFGRNYPSVVAMLADVGKVEGAQFNYDKNGCAFAGPGRGDCEHAVGLPGKSVPGQHDGPDDTVDAYGKPNGWCWFCWRGYRIARLEEKLHQFQQGERAEAWAHEATTEALEQAQAKLKKLESLLPMQGDMEAIGRMLEERTLLKQEMERRFDCHGGPGTTSEACGACVSCITRYSEGLAYVINEARKVLVTEKTPESALAKLADVLDRVPRG